MDRQVNTPRTDFSGDVAFVDFCNNERYHESRKNVTPADVYFGRDEEILERRKQIEERTLKLRRKHYRKMTATTQPEY